MLVIVINNGQYLATHGDLCPDSFHIVSSIKSSFEYLFGAFLLLVIANLLPTSIHSLRIVVIMKQSGVGV